MSRNDDDGTVSHDDTGIDAGCSQLDFHLAFTRVHLLSAIPWTWHKDITNIVTPVMAR